MDTGAGRWAGVLTAGAWLGGGSHRGGPELKVARLAAEGRSNPEIAELLVVSRRTIQTHIGNVLAKLGIASRRDLVLAAAENRLEQLGGETA